MTTTTKFPSVSRARDALRAQAPTATADNSTARFFNSELEPNFGHRLFIGV